jgi:hypothetical protein
MAVSAKGTSFLIGDSGMCLPLAEIVGMENRFIKMKKALQKYRAF